MLLCWVTLGQGVAPKQPPILGYVPDGAVHEVVNETRLKDVKVTEETELQVHDSRNSSSSLISSSGYWCCSILRRTLAREGTKVI